MSVQAMAWAIDQQIVRDAPARHVLLCLANYADKLGKTAFPSALTLSTDTGLSERTIRTKLALLEQAGLIAKGNQRVVAAHIDRADRRPICYDLCMSRPAGAAPRDSERGAGDDTTGCSPRMNGVQLMQERGAPAAPKPSFNRQEPSMILGSASPAEKPPAARASRLPEDWVLPKTWGELALTMTQQFAGELKNWVGGAWTPEHVCFEADKFRDYWHGKSGKDAAKADWLATWRNWVRNAGPLCAAGVAGGGGAWWSSPEAALAKASHVGVGPAFPGESDSTWHMRIRAAINNGGKPPAPRAQPITPFEQMPSVDGLRTGASDASRAAVASVKDILRSHSFGATT